MEKKKFTGKLRKKTKPRKSGFLAAALRDWGSDEKTASNELLKKLGEEDTEKLLLLGEHYKITKDQNADLYIYELCLHLARDFVPGFQEEVKRGAKKKWNYHEGEKLKAQINELKVKNPGKSIVWACGILSKKSEWKSFLEAKDSHISSPDPQEALRQAYYLFISRQRELQKVVK